MLVTDLFNQNQLSPHLSKQALFDLGVARQQAVPSRELAAYVPVDRNPLDLIAATESQMLPDLLALRHQRMGVSPFTFFRGTAELMEHDLAEQSHSGIQVIISGDAHVNNYGFYASPERKLLFGLNDFDEARIGNWEDDLKRLLVSTYLAGQSNGFSERDLLPILTNVTRTYRYGVKYANALILPERFYFSYEIHDMMATIDRISDDQPHKISTILEKILKKSPQKNSEQVIAKLTTADEEGPPLLYRTSATSQACSPSHQGPTDPGLPPLLEKHPRGRPRLPDQLYRGRRDPLRRGGRLLWHPLLPDAVIRQRR